ncbi:MAG: thiamine-phosphate kinase [Kiritimatiellales bacterium]|nr:thiamine-phosphate kinase [Kiritimatiellales bacterium]
METLGDIRELEAIKRLTQKLGTNPYLRTGAGDDCAVAEVPGSGTDQVFTTDPVIENVHFLPSDEPYLIGSKAVGRVLSDIAAMGARPQWLLVNVVAPADQVFQALEEIYDGVTDLGKRFGATVIGGDLTKGPCLELHVFGTGTLPAGSALLRSGAKAGDHVFVTGPLGGSSKGKHLSFVPRVEEGIFLRETGLVNAMMDISDGLATDLRHILSQSGVGAILDAEAIPKNEKLANALYDGEDFELLLTVSPEHAAQLNFQWLEKFGEKLPMIGTVTEQKQVLQLRTADGTLRTLEERAFEHFMDMKQREE